MKKINILSSGILILYSFILINCSKKQELPLPPPTPPSPLIPTTSPTPLIPATNQVVSLDSNQIIFHNLKWNCPMGCTIEIKTIYNYISPNIPINVFIKKASDVNWIPVPPITQVVNYNSFSYQINAISWLVVYTESDMQSDVLYEVKIVY